MIGIGDNDLIVVVTGSNGGRAGDGLDKYGVIPEGRRDRGGGVMGISDGDLIVAGTGFQVEVFIGFIWSPVHM